jgi:eukaryotic-like serine/threonine-protein kinase
MTPDRWTQINELYQAALDHEANQRATFLERACHGDTELRREVESLIAAHEQAGSFITEPALKMAAKVLAGDQTSSLVGVTFSHYRIESLLGVGGMGEVYLAEDTSLGRKMALKLLPKFFTTDTERLHRFEQEARSASALNHPNILTIYEIGQDDGRHYTATEFVDGETLREHLTNSTMTINEVVDVAIQIASALQAAHQAEIVHRDIKPENIMLRRDRVVKVLDFGLAKLLAGKGDRETGRVGEEDPTIATSPSQPVYSSVTNPGVVMGTVRYMSPEQARGLEVDARTDIWSLGVVLYEMVTGRAPFAGETPSHVVVSILESQPSAFVADLDVPPALERIVTKALRKDMAERYQTASDLALDLKSLKQDLDFEARLKRSSRSDRSEGQAATKSDERAAVAITSESTAHTVDVAIARPASSAEYLVGEIKRHKRGAVFAAAVMILAVTTFVYSFYLKRGGEHLAPSGEAIDSLAVLPFVNETADPNTEYLADGISDSVINSLSRLPKLRVISLNAVLRYRGKQIDPQAVGRDLNVRAVLMGSMTQQGDSLAISTELVDARDNRRLWGEQYNRKRSDILSVQEEIARKISEGLRLRLSGEEKKQLEKRYTQNTEAYFLYSLGRYHSEKLTKEGLKKGIEYYEKAIGVDPKYALAYVGLFSAYHDLQGRGFEIPKETWRKREWAALKAVELDDTLSEAHVALAVVKFYRLDRTGGEKECQRALELDPNSFEANRRYAIYLSYEARADEALVYAKRANELDQTRSRPGDLGAVYFVARQYDAAIEEYLKAIEKSPANANSHFLLGEAYVAKGMYKDGIAELQKAVALDNAPERWDRYPMLAYAYAVSGKRDDALKILAEQKRLAKQRYIASYNFAIIYTGLDDKARAFEYLNKAYDEGMHLVQVPSRPLFDSLRSDPRYTELLHRLNRAP